MNDILITIISSFAATIFSTITVFLTDKIRYRYIEPKEEFKSLRRRISSTLDMYACYYSNPHDVKDMVEEIRLDYKYGSDQLRQLAVDVKAFANEKYYNSYYGISNDKLIEVAKNLICLSNSFFTPFGQKVNTSEVRFNKKLVDSIKSIMNLPN